MLVSMALVQRWLVVRAALPDRHKVHAGRPRSRRGPPVLYILYVLNEFRKRPPVRRRTRANTSREKLKSEFGYRGRSVRLVVQVKAHFDSFLDPTTGLLPMERVIEVIARLGRPGLKFEFKSEMT